MRFRSSVLQLKHRRGFDRGLCVFGWPVFSGASGSTVVALGRSVILETNVVTQHQSMNGDADRVQLVHSWDRCGIHLSRSA